MIIYKTTNLVNGKIYIGQDSKNNPKYLGSGVIIERAIKKNGINNFKKDIIEICSNKEELDIREQYWIGLYNSTDEKIGYNITKGGGGCLGLKHSDESKDRMSINSSGNKNPMFGKKFEDAWKRQGLSDSEILEKKRLWLEKRSILSSGENNGMFGKSRYGVENPFFNKTHSNKTKKVLSDKAPKKIVLQFDLNGGFIKEWESTMEVYRELNINCRNCCRGLSKTACGFIWRYKNNSI
jgi:group I intron endonuclease